MQIGDTFYWGEGGHLWVVITDPESVDNDGEFIIVNLTKDVFRAGKECELNVGDHRWITEKTYVSFGDAQRLGANEALRLTKAIKTGAIKTHYPMKPAVLQKIISAAKLSKALPSGFVDLL
ncbi:MAG: hypothetical protein WBE74_16330 [Terracidiphilus sp.]